MYTILFLLSYLGNLALARMQDQNIRLVYNNFLITNATDQEELFNHNLTTYGSLMQPSLF